MSQTFIHPMACVDPAAKIGEGTHIDAFAVVGPDVVIGANCHIHSHAKIARYTTMGDNCRVYIGASVGEEPQDHRCDPNTVSYTEIGNNVVIREYVTIHRPPFEGLKTVIGDHTLLMAFVHIAHDCQLADHVTIANLTCLSGHIIVEPGAVLSGWILAHQFIRFGTLCMVGPRAALRKDVPPYVMVNDDGYAIGMNAVGVKRSGMNFEARNAVKAAIRTYYYDHTLNSAEALAKIEAEHGTIPEVAHFVDFIRTSKRGVIPGTHTEQDAEF